MDLLQSLRRFGQQVGGGWNKAFKDQDAQMIIVRKLYAKNGFEIRNTSSACPEQYDVLKDGEQVAYYRLRHGQFTVDCPDWSGKTIYAIDTLGDGIFDPVERLSVLSAAMRMVIMRIEEEKQIQL